MTTIALKTTAENIYHKMYERFADFVWDFFDDTKGKESTINFPSDQLKETANTYIDYVLEHLFEFMETSIKIILRFVFQVKKVDCKEVYKTLQLKSKTFMLEMKTLISSIKNIFTRTYSPGFDSFFVANSC